MRQAVPLQDGLFFIMGVVGIIQKGGNGKEKFKISVFTGNQ